MVGLLLLALARVEPEEVSVQCDSDFSLLSRGVQIEGAPPYQYLRTGNPKAEAKISLLAALAPGAVVESFEFSFSYLAGYAGGIGGNISVQLAGVQVYQSPTLDKYNYSYPSNHTGYSPPILVKGTNLPISVPTTGPPATIDILASNNDRNIQLLMPLTFNITCKSPDNCIAPLPWQPPAPVTVFYGGDKGPAGTDETNTTGNCFRIPQLARAPDGELLAFAEGRYASCWPDCRPENRIVMRRSTDGGLGNSWGPIQVLWGKTKEERLGGLNYPMPMVDRKTGKVTVFFFQAGCPGGACPVWRITSMDSGKTWSSPPVNMSTVPSFHSVSGGGRGIQLPSGRLVWACGGAACYSDDSGETWRKGAVAPAGPGVATVAGEESIVADGRTNNSLAMFIRSGSRNALVNHAVASSLDGGETWGPARLLPSVVGVTCQGSVGRGAEEGQLLLSAPSSRDLSGYGQNGRENMAVWSYRLNATNMGATGPDPQPQLVGRLWPCKAAYSSFSEDGRLNLFEGGLSMRYERIMLATLNHTFPSPN